MKEDLNKTVISLLKELGKLGEDDPIAGRIITTLEGYGLNRDRIRTLVEEIGLLEIDPSLVMSEDPITTAHLDFSVEKELDEEKRDRVISALQDELKRGDSRVAYGIKKTLGALGVQVDDQRLFNERYSIQGQTRTIEPEEHVITDSERFFQLLREFNQLNDELEIDRMYEIYNRMYGLVLTIESGDPSANRIYRVLTYKTLEIIKDYEILQKICVTILEQCRLKNYERARELLDRLKDYPGVLANMVSVYNEVLFKEIEKVTRERGRNYLRILCDRLYMSETMREFIYEKYSKKMYGYKLEF